MAEPKRSSKLLIYDSRRHLYCVYRAPGDWSSPNTISLIGTDGDALASVLQQVREKVGLATEAADWAAAGTVENPANNEINTIWTLRRPVDSMVFLPAAYGGLLCLKPSALTLFGTMLSPALRSIMQAMPDLFEDR
jgi:hypothetical protein